MTTATLKNVHVCRTATREQADAIVAALNEFYAGDYESTANTDGSTINGVPGYKVILYPDDKPIDDATKQRVRCFAYGYRAALTVHTTI